MQSNPSQSCRLTHHAVLRSAERHIPIRIAKIVAKHADWITKTRDNCCKARISSERLHKLPDEVASGYDKLCADGVVVVMNQARRSIVTVYRSGC
jgi:hypothetical protein